MNKRGRKAMQRNAPGGKKKVFPPPAGVRIIIVTIIDRSIVSAVISRGICGNFSRRIRTRMSLGSDAGFR